MKSWLKKIKRIIKSRNQIIKGLFNSLILRVKIEQVARERLSICRNNKCGYYDKDGSSEMAIGNMGKETCAICGCILKVKTRVPECDCALEELEEKPLWRAVKL